MKNHFYSKLRKFIRTVVKVLNKEGVFEQSNLDKDFYSSDRIYKMIKKEQIPFDLLCKDSILDLIIKHDIKDINYKT